MALGADFQRQFIFQPPPFNFRTYGIILSVVPGDADFYVEVERAPDTGSNQPNEGAAVSIVTGLLMPASGGLVRDILPPDNARRFYRARHHGFGYDPGPWTAWTNGYKPVVLPKNWTWFEEPNIHPPAILTPVMGAGDDVITQPNIAPLAVGEEQLINQAVERRALGTQTVSDLANLTSRNRLVNADAEDLRSYWNSNPSGSGSTTLTVINDGDVITGSRSFKLAHTGGSTEYFYQSEYSGVEATDPGNWLLFRVRPLSRVQVSYKYKVSGANVQSQVFIAEYTAGGSLLTVTQVGTNGTSLIPEGREAELTLGPSTFYVVVRFGAAGSSTGYVIYDELTFIDLVPFTDTLIDWMFLGLKTSAFTVDWQLGSSQMAEINGTNIAITLSNPEPGGRYRLYLKQNSQPDTVTWPTNIKWKNDTTPVLSTTTGRVDRIDLEWTGAVYLGEMTQWWPEVEQVITGAGAIPSAAIFGTTIVDRPHVDPSGIASGQALGTPEVVRDDPVPDITSAAAEVDSGGDLCASEGNFMIKVSWTTVDAPDGSYHIVVQGVGGTTEPSVGFKTFDSGVGAVNQQPPTTEVLQFGPYTVELRRDSDSAVIDTQVTNAVFVQYQLGFCT